MMMMTIMVMMMMIITDQLKSNLVGIHHVKTCSVWQGCMGKLIDLDITEYGNRLCHIILYCNVLSFMYFRLLNNTQGFKYIYAATTESESSLDSSTVYGASQISKSNDVHQKNGKNVKMV